MSLPFELHNRHKYQTKNHWKNRGLITDNFDELYNKYIYSSQCEKCQIPYKNSKDRHMDHCHITGEFRNILCKKCNFKNTRQSWVNNTNQQYITKELNKSYKKGFSYKIRITKSKKFILNKRTTTLEKAIEIRDKFILDNPHYFL